MCYSEIHWHAATIAGDPRRVVYRRPCGRRAPNVGKADKAGTFLRHPKRSRDPAGGASRAIVQAKASDLKGSGALSTSGVETIEDCCHGLRRLPTQCRLAVLNPTLRALAYGGL